MIDFNSISIRLGLFLLLLYRAKEEIHGEIVNYLLTEVVQSNKFESCAVGVTSEVGLTTDRNQEIQCLLFLQNIRSHVVRATI